MYLFIRALKRWRPLARILLLVVVVLIIDACRDEDDVDSSKVYDPLLGGETTAFSVGTNAFELSARNLPNDIRRIFEVGDSFFNQNWVTAPASTEARDGLGPTHNALIVFLLPQPRWKGKATRPSR